MKRSVYTITGEKEENDIELPRVFSTALRRDLIHKTFTNMNSHKFQPQGRKPTAGMDVVADSNDPPTGRGMSRVARAKGGGGGRQGQGAEVASTRGGRQAHPPNVDKVIYKKMNKKERKLALCSAIAATASIEIVRSRGHKLDKIESLPIIVSNDIESISHTSKMIDTLESLNLLQDVKRLESRKARSGKPLLRGRGKKTGKSVLLVTGNDYTLAKRAVGTIPGVTVTSAKNLSVLDLAPGSDPGRLTVYSKSAISYIANIKSTHLEILVKMQ